MGVPTVGVEQHNYLREQSVMVGVSVTHYDIDGVAVMVVNAGSP